MLATVALRHLKRTIKQTPVLLHMFGLVRAAMGPLLGRRKAGDNDSAAARGTTAPPIAPD